MRVTRFAAALIVTAATVEAQSTDIVITGVTVIDGTGAAPRVGFRVLVRDGRIHALGPADSVAIPARAARVDGAGRFLIPGLWDMHVHLAKAGETALDLFIANGVTSVRDMGGEFALVRRWREDIRAGIRVGPRIRSAGPIIESASRFRGQVAGGGVEPYPRTRAPVGTVEDARRVVDSIVALGADFIKVRTVESTATYHAIASAARRRGVQLAAHGDVAPPDDILRAGQQSVEHAFLPPLSKLRDSASDRITRDLARARVAVVPTLVNYYQWLLVSPDSARRVVEDSLGSIDPRRRYVHGYLLEDWREQVAEREGLVQAAIRRFYMPRLFRDVLRDLRRMHRDGVLLLPGTDVAVALMYPGFMLADELGYFVDRIGMTPMEALLGATRRSAEFSGMADSLGTVEVGKLADLVLLDADPLADVRNVGRVHAVIARGRLYDRARLDSLLAAARQPRAAEMKAP